MRFWCAKLSLTLGVVVFFFFKSPLFGAHARDSNRLHYKTPKPRLKCSADPFFVTFSFGPLANPSPGSGHGSGRTWSEWHWSGPRRSYPS